MRASGSSSKRKSAKRKRDKRKKSGKKESKRRSRHQDSASSYSENDSFNSEDTSKLDRGRRKNKPKKLRRDSSSSPSSSDDRSVSSDSESLSTHKRRQKHSKTRQSRVSLKSKKKRDHKRYACTSSDSDAGNARKRKRVGSDVQKKSSKKRSRKYLSSDSESCPTFRSSSSLDGENLRSTKVNTEEEKERVRGRESKRACDKQRVRSSSYSPCGRGSDHSIGANDVVGEITYVDNPRRLKSVIAVVEQSCDEGDDRWVKDPHKEEIVYDQEDYPSPKSPESYEGEPVVECDNDSHGTSSKRFCVENFVVEEATKSEKPGIYEGGQKNAGETQSEGAHNDNFDKKEMDVLGPAALGGEDLESILRQKALENLRKFRGKMPVGPKSSDLKASNNESDLSAGRVDSVLYESTKQDSSSAPEINSSSEGIKLQDDELVETEYRKNELTADEAVPLGCSKEDKGTNSRSPLSEHELRSDVSTGAGATDAYNSSMTQAANSVARATGDSSVDQQNEDNKDGSQFEQRTMSVMRGGEMVQVSYKVYIPKKAPALARRQLRR